MKLSNTMHSIHVSNQFKDRPKGRWPNFELNATVCLQLKLSFVQSTYKTFKIDKN